MVLDNEFSIVSIGQLTVPAVLAVSGGALLIKGDLPLGVLLVLVSITIYLLATQIAAKSAERIERIKSRRQESQLKIARENREHSREKAEYQTKKNKEKLVSSFFDRLLEG